MARVAQPVPDRRWDAFPQPYLARAEVAVPVRFDRSLQFKTMIDDLGDDLGMV